jgi:hypothetical protein
LSAARRAVERFAAGGIVPRYEAFYEKVIDETRP